MPGASGRRRLGRPRNIMGCEPVVWRWCSMRFIGLDVHRDFCEVAIAEAGAVRVAGRVQTEPAALLLFAQSLAVDDQVALEATGNALEIARSRSPPAQPDR